MTVTDNCPVTPASAKQLDGFDVSHWQGSFDFGNMASRGHKFCFVKATEGLTFVDNQFKRSWGEAPRHGLLIGAYHFYRPKYNAGQQAAHFLNVLGAPRVGDLPCVLDLETRDGVKNSIIKAGCLKWLQMVEAATGKTPIIYMSPGFAEDLGDLSDFAKYPLWLAHYGTKHPRVPQPWVDYTFWQYTDKGGLDLNVFKGDVAQLRALAKIT